MQLHFVGQGTILCFITASFPLSSPDFTDSDAKSQLVMSVESSDFGVTPDNTKYSPPVHFVVDGGSVGSTKRKLHCSGTYIMLTKYYKLAITSPHKRRGKYPTLRHSVLCCHLRMVNVLTRNFSHLAWYKITHSQVFLLSPHRAQM
jgi:hypothetical protein